MVQNIVRPSQIIVMHPLIIGKIIGKRGIGVTLLESAMFSNHTADVQAQ